MPIDIRKPLRKMLPFLRQAHENNLNEADTVVRLMKTFEDVLGWDLMSEISREEHLKNKFVDIALKLDGVIKLLVEAKGAGEKLRDHHVEQAERYASENNFHWAVLTNGVEWNLYHLTYDEGIEYEKAFSIDLTDESKFDSNAGLLALLHKQSIKQNEHEDFWTKSTALNAESIGRALFEEPVLHLLRREIHRRPGGVLIDIEDLAEAIHKLLSDEARVAVGPLKIRHSRPKHSRRAAKENEDAPGQPAAPGEVKGAPAEATLPAPVLPAKPT